MKRVAWAVLVAVVAVGVACRDDARITAPIERPLLWAAEKDGATTYLFGTMHAGIDAKTQLPPAVWRTLAAAPRFAMETDPQDPALAARLRPGDTSLRQALGDTDWHALEAALGAEVAARVDRLSPMVAASLLSSRGLPATPSMDRALADHARAAAKPLVYLEAAASQLALLDRWLDVRAIRMMLASLPANKRRNSAMITAYITGDDRALATLADDPEALAEVLSHGYTAAEYAQQREELQFQRNTAWIPAIEQLHASGGSFVAVGALHLVGPRSVCELLARDGYHITRIML